MSTLSRKDVVAFSIIFLLLVMLISNIAITRGIYAEAVLTTATQISNSDSEIPSNTTAVTNTSLSNLEIQNQNVSITTITLSTTITVTSILFHTTTLTSMVTVSRGVAENQVVIFVIVIGTIAIIVGYLAGYNSAMSKQQEAISKVQKRSKT